MLSLKGLLGSPLMSITTQPSQILLSENGLSECTDICDLHSAVTQLRCYFESSSCCCGMRINITDSLGVTSYVSGSESLHDQITFY